MKRAQVLAPRILFEIVFLVTTLYAARPAFATRHLPLQDLPQHMAAISILRRYPFDATLRSYFELTLSRTQYLLVYVLGVILSAPLGVEGATRWLVALTVVSIPYALRFALKRTGGDERWAALAWPFLWNPQMMFGFVNYMLGFPIALVAIGLFADKERRTVRRRQIELGALALGAFYSHLIPFGLLGLGVLAQLDLGGAFDLTALTASEKELAVRVREVTRNVVERAPAVARRLFHELVFLAPSLLAVVVWIVRSPARDASVRAGGVGQEIALTWPNKLMLPAQFKDNILNLGLETEAQTLIAWGLCLMAVLALARDGRREPGPSRVAWLPFVCAQLYILSPESYGWIWPIHTRFAVAAVLLLPLCFARTERELLPWAVVLSLSSCTIGLARDLVTSFQRWDEAELGDLEAALDHTQPDRRLIALVPPMRSGLIPSNVPLLHAAAYYQVRGGAVATFSFIDFPQSPIRYREDGPRPLRLRPRWEWETSLRDADPRHTYYDYVLARAGGFDEAARMPDDYVRLYAGAQWNLYERRK